MSTLTRSHPQPRAHAGENAGPPPGTNGTTPHETIYLAGRPSLRGFVRYVQAHASVPTRAGDLVEDWQAARSRITELEQLEAGAADHPPIAPLGKQFEPQLLEFFADPLVRHTFNSLPTDIVMVSLDHLVVYQKHIDMTHVRRLREQFDEDLDEAQVFRICLPHDHPRPPVHWAGTDDDRFVFVSPSNDLRFLGAIPLEPSQITRWAPHGAVVGTVGLAVGFGSNFLNAFYAAGRVILNNGSHRAYALREAGVTHVPCILQHAAGREELDLVAPKEVRRRPELYLENPRPPMLRDYFDPELHRSVPSIHRVRQLTVRFQVEETSVPAL